MVALAYSLKTTVFNCDTETTYTESVTHDKIDAFCDLALVAHQPLCYSIELEMR